MDGIPKITAEQAFELINDFALMVAQYTIYDTKTNERHMLTEANNLAMKLTGKKLPKELREKILQ